MNNNKPRNRERRTRSGCVSIEVRLSRDSFEQLKEMERSKQLTREEIFLKGLQSCGIQ